MSTPTEPNSADRVLALRQERERLDIQIERDCGKLVSRNWKYDVPEGPGRYRHFCSVCEYAFEGAKERKECRRCYAHRTSAVAEAVAGLEARRMTLEELQKEAASRDCAVVKRETVSVEREVSIENMKRLATWLLDKQEFERAASVKWAIAALRPEALSKGGDEMLDDDSGNKLPYRPQTVPPNDTKSAGGTTSPESKGGAK